MRKGEEVRILMYKNIIRKTISIILAIIVFSASGIYFFPEKSTASAQEYPSKLYARSAILIDAETGTVIYEKKPHKRISPASTCKVLTAVIALENSNLNDKITISSNALKGQEDGGAHIGLDENERVSMKDVLHGMLLVSANECAIAIAENVAGSERRFAKLMNQKVNELNLSDSHFVNPYGFYDKEHYSSVYDLAYITQYALKNKDFVKIFSAEKYTIKPTNKHKESNFMYNNHTMIKHKYHAYEGVIGGKRGYITESGFNLITVAKRNNMTLIAVVAQGNSLQGNNYDTKVLFDYGFSKYRGDNISKTEKGKPLSSLLNEEDYLQKRCKLKANNMDVLLSKDPDIPVSLSVDINDDLKYPLEEKDVVGQLVAKQDDKIVGSIDIVAKQKIQSKLKHNLMIGASVLILLVLIIVTILVLSHLSSKRNGKKLYSIPSSNMRSSKHRQEKK